MRNVFTSSCRLRFAGVMFALVVNLSLAAPEDESPALRALAQVESVTQEEGIKVFYDYIEDGVLKGGKVFLPAPQSSPQQLASLAVHPAWTLIDNGPTDNRIDLVFVGDGYTASEMDTYLDHIEGILYNFFGDAPLDAYAAYFNVHIVEVVSAQSGVDEPDQGIYRNTALDMTFNCNGIDRLLCLNYSKAWTAAQSAPEVDLVIAVANTGRYGGAGYTDLSTVAGGNGWAAEVALHEFGHSFADLADEYHYGDGSTYTGSEPSEANVSIYNASQQNTYHRKWYQWINSGLANTYQGAMYRQYGIYRPTSNSKMNALGNSFGPVNSEQFIRNIYKEVSPIDLVEPAGGGVFSADTIFRVSCQLPDPDAIEIEWLVDGVPVENGPVFEYSDAFAANTVQTLTARVTDQTGQVIDEGIRLSLMTDQYSWQVWRAGADFTGDSFVGVDDLVIFADAWLTNTPACDAAPLGGDGIVDLLDWAVFARQWQNGAAE